jgi:hypothetical protein
MMINIDGSLNCLHLKFRSRLRADFTANYFVMLFVLENSLHYRNQNDIVIGNESLPIRNW